MLMMKESIGLMNDFYLPGVNEKKEVMIAFEIMCVSFSAN